MQSLPLSDHIHSVSSNVRGGRELHPFSRHFVGLHEGQKGFTMVEIMIVMAVIAVLLMIAVPNWLSAAARSKQSKTMAEMRNIGNAIEVFNVDQGKYPDSGINVLSAAIEERTGRKVTQTDEWDHQFEYVSNHQSYTLRSFGKDGTPDALSTRGPTHSFEADIVYSMGQFEQFPEGTQE